MAKFHLLRKIGCVNERDCMVVKCSPVAQPVEALPILSPAFILITTCIISCESVDQQIENTIPGDIATCIYFCAPIIALHSLFSKAFSL